MTKRLFIAGLLLFVYELGFSQLCTGSLGDPIVNITFGRGSNPGAPIPAAGVDYGYVSNDCPGDGYYTIRNNTSNCFSNSWHNLTADHTGDGNGYFMLVNASYDPGVFYLDTVRGLCGGSTYEFAAWVINVILPSACNGNTIQPNLTFSIENTNGDVLESYNTGNIAPTASPQWRQHGFFFTTPDGVNDIVLRIVNNAPGGCGNDIALDDITFRACGPQLTPSVTGQTATSLDLCEGIGYDFSLNCTVSEGYNNPVFQWQMSIGDGAWTNISGANQLSYYHSFPFTAEVGRYAFRLSVSEAGNVGFSQCSINSEPIIFAINANPVVSITTNSPVCEGESLTLNATGGGQYEWQGPGGYTSTVNNIVISSSNVSHSGLYQVEVTNQQGCTAVSDATVLVNAIPTATVLFSDTAICVNDSIMLQASGGVSYEWTPSLGLSETGISNPMASPATSRAYNVAVTNAEGCTDAASVNVAVILPPVVDAGPDKTIVLTPTLLEATIQGEYAHFYWDNDPSLSDPLVLRPMVSPEQDMVYRLNVVSPNGCGVVSDEVKIQFYRGVFIPTAFTPNSDGLNDVWYIPMLDAYPNFDLKVFNRNGNIVFSAKASNRAWDGNYKGYPQPQGVYPYLLQLNDEANTILKGTITLVR